MKKNLRNGFTFIELMLVAALMAGVGLWAVVNYGRQRPVRDLDSTKLKLVAVLRDASSRATSQSQGVPWGVRIKATDPTNTFFALFSNSYATSTASQVSVLPSTLKFDTSTFSGTNKDTLDIIFNQGTGKTSSSTSVRAYAVGDPTRSFIVWIDSSGLVFEGSSTNIAVGKTASQISTGWGGLASRAIDGNTDGNWANNSVNHTGTGGQDWWQVDLGQNYHIEKVNVWNRTDNCPTTCPRLSDYYVFVSSAPFGATLAATLAMPGVWSNHQITTAGRPTTVPVGVQGRYVAIWIANANFLHMGEVEVYGQ